MKTTPGPWEAITSPPDCGHSVTVYGPAGAEGFRNICSMGLWQPQDLRESNARLIAAAPELLEALKEMLPIVHDAMNADDDDVIGKIAYRASAAIAKAEGR